MATRADRSYQEQLRLGIRKSGQSISIVARMSGIPQPVLHRFAKGERGLNDDTATLLGDYLGITLEPDESANVLLDLIDRASAEEKWLNERLSHCDSDVVSGLEKYRRRLLKPRKEALLSLLAEHRPNLSCDCD